MKVLVATNETQGMFEDDYCSTVKGELVYIQTMACKNPACGCDRGFAGLSSERATTTAMVVDRPELTLTILVNITEPAEVDSVVRRYGEFAYLK
jgi:hypothetical protein